MEKKNELEKDFEEFKKRVDESFRKYEKPVKSNKKCWLKRIWEKIFKGN